MRARRLAWVLGFAGCMHAPSRAPGPAPAGPSVPALYAEQAAEVAPHGEPEFEAEPALPQVSAALEAAALEAAALEAAGLKDSSVGKDGAARVAEQGLTVSLAIAALEEIAEACPDPNDPQCGGNLEAVETKQKLVEWLGFAKDARSAEVLLGQLAHGGYRVTIALENLLTRQAEERAKPCTPPATDAVAEVATSLGDFAVSTSGNGRCRLDH